MNDLSTEIRIGADASGVEAGVGRAKRSLKDLGDSARSAGQTVAAAGKQAGESLATVGDGGEAAAKKIQRDTRSMQSSLQRYLATLEAGSKDSRKYWESMADFKGVDKAALRPLLDQLDAYKAKANAAADASSAFKLSVGGFGVAATALTAVSATAGVAAKAMFDASVSAERLRTMLDFSTGGNSAREVEYLRGVTARLGLEFTSTAKAYGQFQAAAKGTALEGDKARAVFESVAKASAVMGLSADDTSGVLLALQQMLAKGTVSAEELRGQLGERLPGSFQVAARAMGVTTAELGKMLEQGQIVADDFLPKFGKALEQNLGGAAEKAANRLDASVNRLNTAWERLKQNGGDAGTSSFMAGQYEILADGFNGVSEAMERARSSGSGFIGQMSAGAVAVAKFANPLQAFSYTAIESGNALKQAEEEFAALQKRGDQMGGNIYYKAEIARLAALIKELKTAQAEKDKLTKGDDSKINPGIVASGQGRERYYQQREKDEEAANAFRLKQAGVPASYLKDMAELIRLNQAGVIVGKEYTDALKKQQDELLKKTGAVKSSNAAANQEQNAYESLIASIRTKIETEKAELSGAGALTESQRLSIKLTQDLASGKLVLSKANKAAAVAALEELAAVEQQRKAAASARAVDAERLQIQEELAQAYVAESKAREAGRAAVTSYAAGIQESNDALQFELSLMGMSEQARNTALEQYRIELDLKKQIAAIDANGGFDEAQREEERARARAAAATAKANAANRAFLDDWKRSVSQYDDIFRRGFADMLNNGKDGWKSFTRSLVTTFKTTVADQIYKMFAQPFVVRVVGSMMGMIGSNAAAGVAGQAGGSFLSSAGGSMLGNMVGGFGAFTGAMGSGFSMAMSGGMGLALEGGAAMLGSATGMSSALAGIGQIAGALGPIALGIGALYAIVSSLDDSGTLHTGGAAQYSAARGLTSGQDATNYNIGFGRVERSDQTISVVSTLAQSLGTALDGMAVSFGQKAGYEIATAFADDSSKDGAWGALRISKDGQELLNWENNRQSRWAPREFGDGEEGYKQYLAAVAKDTRQVLLDMDLPSWADKMLESIGESASLEQLAGVLTQIGSIKTQFVQLGKAMEMFGGISSGMESALLSAAGSIDALTASAAGYYDAVYTEQEKIARSREQLESTLAGYGQSLPATREQYRALVEQQVAAGESGAEFAVVLMGLAGTFAQVVDDIDAQFADLAKSAADVFSPLLESIKQARADVAGTRANMLKSDQAMTASQIAAAIGAAMVYAPNTTGLVGAQGGVTAAAQQIAQRQSALDAARAVASANQQSILAGLNKAVAPRTSAPGMTNDSLWEEIIGRNWQAHVARFGKGWNTSTTTDAERAAAMNAMAREYADAKNADVYAAANWQSGQDAPAIAAAQSALAAAQAALEAAQQAEVQARADYAAQLNTFVLAASNSVGKLSSLREEVVRYYEEQAQAVQTLLDQIGGVQSGVRGAQASILKPDRIDYAALAVAVQQAMGAAASSAYAGSTTASQDLERMSALQGDVLAYYEQQKQAVADMLATAKNLRGVIDDVRASTLTAQQGAAALAENYSRSYAMALSTTGAVRDGYVREMADSLPALATSIKEQATSRAEWQIEVGRVLAQANSAAGLLEADAGADGYESQSLALLASMDAALSGMSARVESDTSYLSTSLGLLGSIDTALAQLEGSTQSAEQVISQAIKDGTASQLTGLRAVVAALRGDPIPAFATGGFHAGGLRLVGENGPELEATGPSRIWSAQQTAALFAGNGQGSNEALVSEIRALRSENQAQAAAMVNMQRELNKLMQRWDSQGMPEERIV